MKSFVVVIASLIVASAVAVVVASSCAYPPREALSNSWVGLSVERRAKLSPVVFHGLAVETYPPMTSDAPSKGFYYTAQFWLISVYKSARELASFFGTGPPVNGVYDIRDRRCLSKATKAGLMKKTKRGYRLEIRICDKLIKSTFLQLKDNKDLRPSDISSAKRVNVTGFYRPNATEIPHCWTPVTSQKYYVIFAEIVNGDLRAKDDGSRGATADWTEQNEGRVWKGVVSAVLPHYEGPPTFEEDINNPLDFEIFKPRKVDKSNVKRNPSKSSEETVSCIEELSRKLHSKMSPSGERSGNPVRSIKELEDIMTHPTWLTETNKKKVSETMGDKNQRIFVAPASSDRPWNSKIEGDQKEHINEIINKFQTLKLKPITDNRITKFVFTNDVDLATSKTVQEHNKEVAAAFMDFNKKLEETLNVRGRKKVVTSERSDVNKDGGSSDSSFIDVVNFLDRNIRKLKDEVSHKQVCRKHNSHSKNDDYELDESREPRVNIGGINRFNELAHTRDGLENILLGLDRRGKGLFKRQILLKLDKSADNVSEGK